MKKTIVLILLLIPMLCFAGALQEKHRSVIAKKNAVAPASCEVVTGAPSQTDYSGGAYATAKTYLVGHVYTPSGNETICQLDFYTSGTGATTACFASIYGMTGSSINLSDVKCTSGSITPATGWLEFPMTSDCSLTGSTSYVAAYNCSGGAGTEWNVEVKSGTGDNDYTTYLASGGGLVGTNVNYQMAIKFYRK